jgi:superfamily II DNA/RNA helicase
MESLLRTNPNLLENLGIKSLNEMQLSMLDACSHNDQVILRSPTGSGKTLAFLLPILQGLDGGNREVQALIIVPSRELAQQIETVWKKMSTGIKVSCCYGGRLRETEENNLTEAPPLVIGTPGRLADHVRRGNINAKTIHTLVLDEFDKILELGFEGEMEEIVSKLSSLQKRILTSATEGVEIPEFVGMTDPERLSFAGKEQEEGYGLAVQALKVPDSDKPNALFHLLCTLGGRPSIIFCNHRETVEEVSNYLSERSIQNVFYHGAMEQRERDTALGKFRNGSSYFLVTTDLAARGLDIPFIRYIIHYHIPPTEAAFTHRNGRTARMERSGTAILMIAEKEYMPTYLNEEEVGLIELPESSPLPEKPEWTTIFIAAGKKDKVNKVDIVGFFAQKAGLRKDDIGLIEVKDHSSFVALRKSKTALALTTIKDEKIKGKKVRIEVAR